MIKYVGYLTEEKLGVILKKIFPDVVAQYKISSSGRTFKVDYFIPSTNTVVEYNGDRHYTQSKTIYRDYLLREYCLEKYNLVSIPYWIQLDSSTFKYYFGMDVEIGGDFRHGFWTKKCTLPADFTLDGYRVFHAEITDFLGYNSDIFNQVRLSLINRDMYQPLQEVFGLGPPNFIVEDVLENIQHNSEFVLKAPCPHCYDIYLPGRSVCRAKE